MPIAKIADIKAAVQREYPEATRLQYHRGLGMISGYGRDLSHRPMGPLTETGAGRYVLAERSLRAAAWETVRGDMIVTPDGIVITE